MAVDRRMFLRGGTAAAAGLGLPAMPAGQSSRPCLHGVPSFPLMGPEGAFITGSDFLIDGGVTASYSYGELAPFT